MLKLWIFPIFVAFFCCVNCGRITVTQSSGNDVDLDLTSECIPTLGELDKDVSGINTHNHCVQLYKEQYCTGQYLIIRPGTGDHSNLHYYGFGGKVRSIGPCFEKCHPDRNANNLTSSPVTVKFYGQPARYETAVAEVILEPNKCNDLTELTTSWTLSAFRAKVPATTCAEFHEFGDCTGDSSLLTVGQHSALDTITFWLSRSNKGGSMSFCGYNCNHSYTLEELDKEDVEPLDGSVTLFRRIDFAGERTNLVLNGGCTKLPEGWNGRENGSTAPPRSIITYGQCILLYGDEGCGDESSLMEAVLGAEPYLFWSNKSLKAIKSCPNVHLEEQRYCGSGNSGGSGSGSGGWLWVVILLLCLAVIVVETVVIWKWRKERIGGMTISKRFGGDNGTDFTEQNRNGATNSSRLPYNHRMETPLIEINE